MAAAAATMAQPYPPWERGFKSESPAWFSSCLFCGMLNKSTKEGWSVVVVYNSRVIEGIAACNVATLTVRSCERNTYQEQFWSSQARLMIYSRGNVSTRAGRNKSATPSCWVSFHS